MNRYASLLIILFGVIMLIPACNKTPSYPENSILGTWMCMEEGALYGYRQYNASIDYLGSDSTFITIFNFYNLGFNIETYATVSDTLITIYGTNSIDDFSGTGHIERDFSAIYWRFSYFGSSATDPQVESVFRRF